MVSRKHAFTMIEMIFAIVIIGITVAGVSQIMTRSGQTMEGALSQEAVFLASMEGARVFSSLWDPNSKDGASELSYSKILDTNALANYMRTCIDPITDIRSNQPCTATQASSVLRYGGIAQDKHRRFHSQPTASSVPYPEGMPDNATALPITGPNGYKHTYEVSRSSDYVNFNNNGFNTNGTGGAETDIKMTEININATENGNTVNLVKMRVYSYNIGEIDFSKRIFE
ncbi:type II secretion system protein [Thiomicrolovo sp. ZZH C-3]